MTNAVDGEFEALARICIFGKERNGCIANFKKLVLVFYERDDGFALVDGIAEKTAERNDVAMRCFPSVRGAGLVAASAIVALGFIKEDLFVFDADSASAASLGANATADAGAFEPFDFDSALDAHVVFFGLEAVVLATGHAELELVRKFASEVAVVQFFCNSVCIDTAARANSFALACRNRSHAGAADARFYATFGKGVLYVIDVFKLLCLDVK